MEAADAITVACLKEQRAYLKKDLSANKKGVAYLHPDDKTYNKYLVECMDEIIKYYGG